MIQGGDLLEFASLWIFLSRVILWFYCSVFDLVYDCLRLEFDDFEDLRFDVFVGLALGCGFCCEWDTYWFASFWDFAWVGFRWFWCLCLDLFGSGCTWNC